MNEEPRSIEDVTDSVKDWEDFWENEDTDE